jgi:hypothetical protein
VPSEQHKREVVFPGSIRYYVENDLLSDATRMGSSFGRLFGRTFTKPSVRMNDTSLFETISDEEAAKIVGAGPPRNQPGGRTSKRESVNPIDQREIFEQTWQRTSTTPVPDILWGNRKFTPSAQYNRASELPVLIPGSRQWSDAVNSLRKGGTINNARVPNASTAKKLLQDAFSGSNALQHRPTYTNESEIKTYQLHPAEIDEGQGLFNDLSHIKWRSPDGDGHIWFGRPDTSGDSVHYVSQRMFDYLKQTEGLTDTELNELGIRVGGNLLGKPGSHDHRIQPGKPIPGVRNPRK